MTVQKHTRFDGFARYTFGNDRKKASEATLIDRVKQRVMQPRYLFLAALSSAALVVFLALWTLGPQTSAAHPAATRDTVNITFTVTVVAGTPPTDVLFWVCPDAQNDGTGCDQMNDQPDGTFVYQLATTTDTTYQHITIEWSHGRLPTDQGPIPAPPAHMVCDYHPVTFKASDPHSYTCKADFTALAVTPTIPVVTATTTPATSPATDPTRPTSDDNSTLVTGLQIVIGVGLFLFVILVIILIWQRMGTRRR